MAKSRNSRRRAGSQAKTLLAEQKARLREQRLALDKLRKEQRRQAAKTKVQAASILRKAGVYKPKRRITTKTVQKSGALQRKLRAFKELLSPLTKETRTRVKVPAAVRRSFQSANVTYQQLEKERARIRRQDKERERIRRQDELNKSAVLRQRELNEIRRIADATKPEDNSRQNIRVREGRRLTREEFIAKVHELAIENPETFRQIIEWREETIRQWKSGRLGRMIAKERYKNLADYVPGWEIFYQFDELVYYHGD